MFAWKVTRVRFDWLFPQMGQTNSQQRHCSSYSLIQPQVSPPHRLLLNAQFHILLLYPIHFVLVNRSFHKSHADYQSRTSEAKFPKSYLLHPLLEWTLQRSGFG